MTTQSELEKAQLEISRIKLEQERHREASTWLGCTHAAQAVFTGRLADHRWNLVAFSEA